MNKKIMIAAVATAAVLSPVTADAQTDPMEMSRQAAANQVGIMEYCQAKGFADAEAVNAQRAAFANLLPAPAGSPSTEAAEALGRKGTLSANGMEHTLASMADGQHTTVGGLCGQMATAAKHVAASMAAMPAMPAGMPAMSGMPAGMPSMPGMPGVPGAPK